MSDRDDEEVSIKMVRHCDGMGTRRPCEECPVKDGTDEGDSDNREGL